MMTKQIVYLNILLQNVFIHLNNKINYAHHVINDVKKILTNKFSQNQTNVYVIDLYDYYELFEKFTIKMKIYAQIFFSNVNLYWQIR